MGQRYLARPGISATADETNGGSSVVGRLKWTETNQRTTGRNIAGDGVDFGDFEAFLLGKVGEDAGESAGEHGFATARTAHHKNIVAASSGNFQGALGLLLAQNFRKIKLRMNIGQKLICFDGFERSQDAVTSEVSNE